MCVGRRGARKGVCARGGVSAQDIPEGNDAPERELGQSSALAGPASSFAEGPIDFEATSLRFRFNQGERDAQWGWGLR